MRKLGLVFLLVLALAVPATAQTSRAPALNILNHESDLTPSGTNLNGWNRALNSVSLTGIPKAPAAPQDNNGLGPAEVEFGYKNLRIREEDFNFHLNGFYFGFSYFLLSWLAVTSNFAAAWGNPFELSTTAFLYQFGLLMAYRETRWIPFFLFTAGGARLRFSQNGFAESDNGFALEAGGGLDVHLGAGWIWQVLCVTYLHTRLFDAHQNNVQIRSGLAYSW